jgi:hypothetical protein
MSLERNFPTFSLRLISTDLNGELQRGAHMKEIK